MMTTSEWVKRAKEIHGDKYDYSKTEYKGYSKKLKIVCKNMENLNNCHMTTYKGRDVQSVEGQNLKLKYLISLEKKILSL